MLSCRYKRKRAEALLVVYITHMRRDSAAVPKPEGVRIVVIVNPVVVYHVHELFNVAAHIAKVVVLKGNAVQAVIREANIIHHFSNPLSFFCSYIITWLRKIVKLSFTAISCGQAIDY